MIRSSTTEPVVRDRLDFAAKLRERRLAGRDGGVGTIVEAVVELALAEDRGIDRLVRQERLPVAFGEHGEVAARLDRSWPEYAGAEAGVRGVREPAAVATILRA